MQNWICKLNMLNKKRREIQLAEFCRFRTSDVSAYGDSDSHICFGLANSLYQDILSPQLFRSPISCTCQAHCILALGNSTGRKNIKDISYEMSVRRLVTSTLLVPNIFRDI